MRILNCCHCKHPAHPYENAGLASLWRALFDNPRRLERLRKLSALKAIETWMDAGFTIGEDDALLFAIGAGTRTKLSDAKITDLIWD